MENTNIKPSVKGFEDWQKLKQAEEDLIICLIQRPKHNQIKKQISLLVEGLQ